MLTCVSYGWLVTFLQVRSRRVGCCRRWARNPVTNITTTTSSTTTEVLPTPLATRPLLLGLTRGHCWGAPTPSERVGAPHQCPLCRWHYLCYFMLTCAHSDDAGTTLSSTRQKGCYLRSTLGRRWRGALHRESRGRLHSSTYCRTL